MNKDERLEVFYMFQYLRPGKVPRSFFIFVWATSQSPCLHENLAVVAITGKTRSSEKTQGNGERTNLICAYFVRYCKYDIFQGEMAKNVEIGRLHKDFLKMWIGELIGRKFSTFKNMKKC